MWATLSIATLVKCVNDKDERVLRVARKGADQTKEEGSFHRPRSNVRVLAKALRYNGSKRGEEYREIVDESGKNGHGVTQSRVVPPAEKHSSKVVSLVKVCTD